LWQLAEELIPPGHAGEFNQALMELGATVCTPTSPRCGECPLAPSCEARRRGIQGSLPELAREAAPTPLRMAAAVVWRGHEVLLVKRHISPPPPPRATEGRVAEAQGEYRTEEGRRWWAGM